MSAQGSLHKLDPSIFQPFHGYQSSFLPLSSGHYLYLASWDSTPTPYEKFSNLWLITPEDKRYLFADPPGSASVVTLYHEFQEIKGASIGMKWTGANQVRIQCESEGGYYQLTASLVLEENRRSRALLKLGAPPSRMRFSRPMVRISNFLVNALAAREGACLFGRTETGQPFYQGETEHLYLVKGGAATLNGKDLGTFSAPTWLVSFGDAVPFRQSVLKIGTLYIPFGDANQQEMGVA